MSLALTIIIYLAIGLVAGISSGLFGIGGGIIFVPALTAVFYSLQIPSDHIMHLSTGSSLAAMALTTLIASIAHHRLGHMNGRLVLKIMPGTIVGAMTGVLLSDQLATETLRWLFTGFLVVIALSFLVGKRPRWAHHTLPSGSVLLFVAWIIGIFAGLLGIGGGLLLMPFLLFFNVPFKEATATTVASTFPTVTFGAMTAMLVGFGNLDSPSYSVGYLYFPAIITMGMAAFFGAPIGAYLNHKLPAPLLKRGFALLLLLVAWKMLPF